MTLLLATSLGACGGGGGGDTPAQADSPPGATGDAGTGGGTGTGGNDGTGEDAGSGGDSGTGEDTGTGGGDDSGSTGSHRLDPDTLNVKADLGVYFRTTETGGSFNEIIGEFLESTTQYVFGIDYRSGTIREFASNGRFEGDDSTLRLITGGNRFFYLYDSPSYFRLSELDPRDGSLYAGVEVYDSVGTCLAVLGDDLFYGTGGDFRTVPDFATVGFVGDGDDLTSGDACGRQIATVAGNLVQLDYALPLSGPADGPIEVWTLDAATGQRTARLLAIDNSDERFIETIGSGAWRLSTFALATDGVYIAVQPQAGVVEVWFSAYGEGDGPDGALTPSRLIRIDDPAQLGVPLSAAADLFIKDMAADDGYLLLSVEADEVVAGVRYREPRLLVADTYGGDVDVLDLGVRTSEVAIIHHDGE
jgi:hypothetical protein